MTRHTLQSPATSPADKAAGRLYTRRRFIGQTLALAALPPLLNGCKTVDAITEIGVGSGVLARGQADSLRRTGTAVAKTFEQITPEQEYYLGRSVGAVIIDRYGVLDLPAANDYLNLLGQSLVQVCQRPETFAGYRFLLLDSDEINAFAAPGGFIFISRGMIQCCEDEKALAAVLAHEIGHIQYQHGLQAIERSRLTSALGILAAEGVKTFAGQELAQLVRAFEGSIGDITATLINNGYSRAFEREADQAALQILTQRGYPPAALAGLLETMADRLQPGGLDFAKTHPSPQNRLREIRSELPEQPASPVPPGQHQRFARFRTQVG